MSLGLPSAGLLDEERGGGAPCESSPASTLRKLDSDLHRDSRASCHLGAYDTSPFGGTGTELSPGATLRRRRYLGLTSDVLRTMCQEREVTSAHALDREQLISLLEDDDRLKEHWVQGHTFEYLFLGIVVLNAIAIGIEIDHQDQVPHVWFLVLNYVFFALFLSEILIKLACLGPREYFRDAWNIFDVFVIIASSVDLIAARLTPSGEMQIVRMCRMCRLARIFKELGVLVQSFVLSMRALSWVLCGMLIWFYLAACFTTLFIGRRRFEHLGEEAEQMQELRGKFGTIPLSMFALFEIMTLEGWGDYVRPFLSSHTAHLVLFFIFFIFVSAFFLLNLVTAVVVDRTVTAQEEVRESKEKERKQLRQIHVGLICDHLQQAALPEDSKMVSREAFAEVITRDQEVAETMRWLRWNRTYMLSIFDSVDIESSGRAPLRQLAQLLGVGDEPLDTANYARFQASLSQRLEQQEQLLLAALRALQQASPQQVELPEQVLARLQQRHASLPVARHILQGSSDSLQ